MHAGRRQDHQIRAQPVIRLLQKPVEELRRAGAGVRTGADAVAVDGEHRNLRPGGEGDDHQEGKQAEEKINRRRTVQERDPP